jgi:hypothetical protein
MFALEVIDKPLLLVPISEKSRLMGLSALTELVRVRVAERG